MPDVQEVFRLATNKVKPDPDALERQVRRQRSEVRKSRVRAYVAVAAVLVVLGVAIFAISRAVQKNDTVSDNRGTNTTGAVDWTFLQSLPDGATPQVPATIDRQGRQTSVMSGVPLDGYAPSVSFDGSHMALVASPNEVGYNQIVVMGTDGTGAHFVSTPNIDVAKVAISPDGTQIAFEGTAEGNTDIYVVNSDGTGLLRLTRDPSTDQFPTWSPDGSTIAYDNAGKHEQDDAQYSKTAEIFTVAADGGAPKQITHNNGFDAAPSYRAQRQDDRGRVLRRPFDHADRREQLPEGSRRGPLGVHASVLARRQDDRLHVLQGRVISAGRGVRLPVRRWSRS